MTHSTKSFMLADSEKSAIARDRDSRQKGADARMLVLLKATQRLSGGSRPWFRFT